MKIIDKRVGKEAPVKLVEDIPVGTVFTCSEGLLYDKEVIYLRTYAGIVCLSNPQKTWSNPSSCFSVKDYVVLNVTLTVKDL